MIGDMRINVHYDVYLSDADFKKILKEAEEQGLDHGDAGKVETVRRYFIDQGMDQANQMLQIGTGVEYRMV